jgi:hypothetical protein
MNWATLPDSQHFGVEGHAEGLGWGLGFRVTSNSITNMDLHKPNNKLINV